MNNGEGSADGKGVDESIRQALHDIDELQRRLIELRKEKSKALIQFQKVIDDKFSKLEKPYYEQRAAVVERIPNFWGNVIIHHPKISKVVDERDRECLHFLKKLEVEEFESGYRLKFVFSENPFFDNEELIKEFSNAELNNVCTVIKWKENLDLSNKVDGTKLGTEKVTFFSWLADTLAQTTYEIAEAIKDDLWPAPLQYYQNADDDVTLLKNRENETGMGETVDLDDNNGAVELSWGTLPSVILREVIGYLASNLRSWSLDENKKSLLNLRLANGHWRDEMDSCLELERLRSWTRLELEKDGHEQNPTNVASIQSVHIYSPNPIFYVTNLVLCPTKMLEVTGDGRNPFPAKSLTVTGKSDLTDANELNCIACRMIPDLPDWMNVLKWDDLFQFSGKYLTSLSLMEIVVTVESLKGILISTPNLKALSLNDVYNYDMEDEDSDEDSNSVEDCRPTLSSIVLPALRHVRFIHYKDEPFGTENVRLRQWILVPYRQQLETLKVDDVGTGMALGKAETEFSQLTRLTVWSVKAFNFLLEHKKFPKLTSLTLTDEEREAGNCKYLLEDLRFHIALFAGELIDLHLYLHFRSHITSIRLNLLPSGKVFNFEGKKYLNEFRWSTAGVIFSKLKNFSIRTSMVVEEEESVREMLKCVPNLEILNLILLSGSNLEQEQQLFRSVVEWQWNQCPKLRKITLWEGSEKVILTEHFNQH